MFLLKFLFIFVLINYIQAQNSLIVETECGLVQGKALLTVGLNRPYLAFQGIPYAEPPIGDLRFKPPVPKTPWEGVWNATFDRSICTQGLLPVTGSEDCLFLNVYKPILPKGKLPVMVFIHGGNFDSGSSTYETYGPDYLLDKDVIVVTLNYRLGIFGFLSTGTLEVPGNNGLKDQNMALKWVQQNIAYFGGDPENVVIFGQSAGSASVSYHLQSPKSKGLFQKAIMESGTSLCLWALSRQVPEMTKVIASSFDIDVSSWETIIEGLRKIDASELQARTLMLIADQYLLHSDLNNPRDGLLLGPVQEPDHKDAFFSAKSHDLLSSKPINDIPIIIGFNSMEATFPLIEIIRMFLSQFDVFPLKLAPIDMNLKNKTEQTNVGLEIKHKYFGIVPIPLSNVEVIEYVSHDQFIRGIHEFIRLVYSKNSVYFYEFTYEGHLAGVTNRTHEGVAHGEELAYIWRSFFPPTAQDVIVRERMTTLWTNFAKFGNPTPDLSLYFIWQNVIDDNMSYLDIGNDLIMKNSFEDPKMVFWNNLYEKYGNPPFDTY